MTFKYTGIGSREIDAKTRQRITRLAGWLSSRKAILRSGGAKGSDTSFDEGHDGEAEIFLPWNGYNGLWVDEKLRYRLVEDAHLQRRAEALMGKVMPLRGRPDSHVALFTRNCFQILGPSLNDPSDVVIYASRGSSGTQATVDLADYLEIPCFNILMRRDRIFLKDFLEKCL